MKIYVIALVIFFIGWVTVNVLNTEERKFEKLFNQLIEEKILEGEERLYLRDITGFKWSKVCYLRGHPKQDGVLNDEAISNIIGTNYVGRRPRRGCDTGLKNGLVFVSKEDNYLINLNRCAKSLQDDGKPTYANLCFGEGAFFQISSHPNKESWKILRLTEEKLNDKGGVLK